MLKTSQRETGDKMTNSSKTYLDLESLKCLSHPQTFPTISFGFGSLLYHQVAMFLLLSLVQGGPLPNLSCPFSSCLLI
jgi:hypothetical protein